MRYRMDTLRRGLAMAVTAALLSLYIAGCGAENEVRPTITISPDGVEHVAWRGLPDVELDIERVADWDLWDPSGDYLFNDIVSVDGGVDRFFLLDAGNRQVVVVDATGSVERVLSREGSGPGELRIPTWLDVRGEEVWVADVANRRFALFGAAGGDFLADRRWPGSARIVNPFRVIQNDDVLHGGSWPLTVAELALMDPVYYLARFAMDAGSAGPGGSVGSSSQGVADTLLIVPAPPYMSVPMTDREGQTRLPYFGFPAFSEELRWDARGGTVVTVSATDYRIEIREPDGRLYREIRLAAADLPITDAHRAWYWDEVFPRQFFSQEPYEPSAGSRDRFPFAEHLPAVSGIALDTGGRVWVEANLPDPGRTRLDLWSLDGSYLGHAYDLPLPVAFLEDGTFLVQSPGPDGLDRYATRRLRLF